MLKSDAGVLSGIEDVIVGLMVSGHIDGTNVCFVQNFILLLFTTDLIYVARGLYTCQRHARARRSSLKKHL